MDGHVRPGPRASTHTPQAPSGGPQTCCSRFSATASRPVATSVERWQSEHDTSGIDGWVFIENCDHSPVGSPQVCQPFASWTEPGVGPTGVEAPQSVHVRAGLRPFVFRKNCTCSTAMRPIVRFDVDELQSASTAATMHRGW